MALPNDFQFSQASLQDYVDCPRRFHLRYVRRLRWPAIETEPVQEAERHLRQGAAFHRLVRQHLMGVPVTTLSRTVANAELRRWWHNYLESDLRDLPLMLYPEVRLSASVASYQLVARYDLIAIEPGQQVLIVDWKTNRKRPRRAWLSERLQTHVYPYVLVEAGYVLDGELSIPPDVVRMIYWFANFAGAPERFAYDAAQYAADKQYLKRLVQRVERDLRTCPEGDLLRPADDRTRCGICRYRSLCRRGIESAWLDEAERGMTDEPFDFALDFEQIAELDAG